MSTTQIAGRDLQINNHGLLADFDAWAPEIALAMAEEEGLDLSDCHWKVIHFLRDYYATHEMPPSPKVIVKSIGAELSEHVPCTRKHLESLFPDGGCKQACRLAGLPRYYCHSC
ncbi:TusE/DsrC/DsvC family sulfur relay protein [Thiorhodococcus mannitoliphagus]|uniref:Sulfurtransferase n=1 Tax=Thiorhodococcus mannitoliphagus TaxID=329406 RepID=A0A6P1DTB6_9GAMM|nr:TusE/DsrC/DsvC family sulfur relay protein [Thiorhodococcus mannitoliphagus]NEX21059.1 TusE/DsrC/DsvC family sulfur relay protein [Thiorhodococcus mannitoliphagus]